MHEKGKRIQVLSNINFRMLDAIRGSRNFSSIM